MKTVKTGRGIPLTMTVDIDRVRSVLVSFWEPTAYPIEWFRGVESVNLAKGYVKSDYPVHDTPFAKNCNVVIEVEDPATDGDSMRFTLDLAAITKGLQTLADKYPKHFADVMTGDTEQATADLLMQCVVYGEEKFC